MTCVQAIRNGASAVELDLGFTQDGVCVVIHDFSVDRTTDGTGLVGHMTYSEISKLNAAAKHPDGLAVLVSLIPTYF